MVVQKSGYLYVYVSNESNMNVYFDDLVVNHKIGPVLEISNYRAFGTEIATLGAKSFGKLENKYKYNGKELQSKEFSDDSGLEWEDYGARMYDQQIVRFNTIDPHADNYNSWTPYNYVGDNPINTIDPNGMDWASDKDKSIADDLTKQLTDRKGELETQAGGLNKKIDKLKGDIAAGGLSEKKLAKLNKQLAGAESNLSGVQSMIADVSSSISEITEMGATKDMTFGFNDLGADKGAGFISTRVDKDKKAGTEKTVTVINFTYGASDDKDKSANQVHELTHGYQFFKGTFSQLPANKGTDIFGFANNNLKWATEVQAYQRQYSFYGPYPSSSPIYVPNYSGITFDFVKGIKVNGNLVYPPLK